MTLPVFKPVDSFRVNGRGRVHIGPWPGPAPNVGDMVEMDGRQHTVIGVEWPTRNGLIAMMLREKELT